VRIKPWFIPEIPCNEPENRVFYCHIGPAGGTRGYDAITGNVGWGISWYINGLLVPEVTVVRGETYTFVVEGGQNFERDARYHPFYITDDPEGGYGFKTPIERSESRVFAGVAHDRDGNPAAVASGRLCEWAEDPSRPADAFSSFGAYQRTLKLHCEEGQPAILKWTPDQDTPDVVYYQSYTHRLMGWRIRVIDACEIQSNRKSIQVIAGKNPNQPEAEEEEYEYYDDDTSETTSSGPVASVNDDGSLANVPFHSNFPSDFSNFFSSSSSSSHEDEVKPFPVDEHPEEEEEDVRPVTSRITPPSQPKSPFKINQHVGGDISSRNRQNHRPDAAEPPIRQAGQVEPSNEDRPNYRPNKVDLSNWNRQNQRPDVPELPERPPPLQFGFQDGFKSVQSQITVGQSQQQQPDPSGLKPGRVIPLHTSPPNRNRVSSAIFGSSGSSGSSGSKDGFDPSTIILESGFRPIRKSNGPVPPLGFEVEAPSAERKSPSLADSNFATMDLLFVPSDLEKSRYNDPVPVPLPEAIVPVIPGPPQIIFPPQQRPILRPIQQRRPVPALPTPPPPPPPSPQRKSSSILSFFRRSQPTPGHLPSR